MVHGTTEKERKKEKINRKIRKKRTVVREQVTKVNKQHRTDSW